MSTTLARQLGGLVSETRFGSFPADVIATAKRSLTDYVGCVAASAVEPYAASIIEVARIFGNQPDCSAIGSDTKVAAPSAALINGTLAHGFDFDDTHLPSLSHHTAAVVSAILAVGELRDLSGEDVLAGQILGTEIGVRIGRAVRSPEWGGLSLRSQGFFATSAIGTVAAAAGVARALGFGPELTASAIALGCNLASGTVELAKGDSWAKRSQPGWTAKAGLSAALLAEAGFSGPSLAFEGEHGYLKAFTNGRSHPDRLTKEWGEDWGVKEISVKAYPVEHYIQPLVELAGKWRQSEPAETGMITRIEASIPNQIQRALFVPRELKAAPPNPHAAQMSAPYSLALSLTRQGGADLNVEDFSNRFRRDPETLRLASVVEFLPDNGFDAAFPDCAPGRLRLLAGEKCLFEGELACEYGNPRRPMRNEDVLAKFNRNCRGWSDKAKKEARQAIEALPGIGARALMAATQDVARP